MNMGDAVKLDTVAPPRKKKRKNYCFLFKNKKNSSRRVAKRSKTGHNTPIYEQCLGNCPTSKQIAC